MKNRLFKVVVAAFTLAGCSGAAPIQEERLGTVETLYNEGMDLLEGKRYPQAIHTFEELQRQHPYSGWATRAEMMVIFGHYQLLDYDAVIVAADNFIRNHPSNADVPYAIYLKGMSYYEQIKDTKRDQKFTYEALRTFEELVARFPTSHYARDARLKISLCLDHLAGQEMMVGRYYQNQDRYLAAINRFRYVVENYQTTAQTPEALYRLTEVYLALGIEDEATAAAAVLGHNFPSSQWYKSAYNLLTRNNIKVADKVDSSSWLADVWGGIKQAVGKNDVREIR